MPPYRTREAAASELRKPAAFTHPRFGRFVLDRALGTWDGRVKWGDKRVRLSLDAKTEEEARAALLHAAQLWGRQRRWHTQAIEKTIAKLLKLKNSAWLDDGDKPVTAAAFAKRMKLDSVAIEPKGALSLWFDDGDLFWGHSIVVRGNIKKGLTGASIEG